MRDAAHTDTASRRLDGPVALAVAGLVAVSVLASVFLPAATPPKPLAPQDDPACAEWSDGCRVCRRAGERVDCSLPGIACTRTAPECLSRG